MSHPTENENFGLLGDTPHHQNDQLQLENIAGAIETEDPRTVLPKKPGRKRKEPVDEQQITPQATPVKRSSRLQAAENVANKENVLPSTTEEDQFAQLQQQQQQREQLEQAAQELQEHQQQQQAAQDAQVAAQQDSEFNRTVQNTSTSSQPNAETTAGPEQSQSLLRNTSGQGEMENMGYDQNNTTQMANLGRDQGAPTPGGQSMGAPSMGAPTPYR